MIFCRQFYNQKNKVGFLTVRTGKKHLIPLSQSQKTYFTSLLSSKKEKSGLRKSQNEKNYFT